MYRTLSNRSISTARSTRPARLLLNRSFGFSWSPGFLLTPFLQKAGMVCHADASCVVDELTTTFKSHYSHQISLADALNLDVAHAYNAKRTGREIFDPSARLSAGAFKRL